MRKISFCLVICFILIGFSGVPGCISSKNADDTTPSDTTKIPSTFLPRTPFPTPTCEDYQNGTITMNPVGLHYVGDVFEINGTANLPPGKGLNISIFPHVNIASGKIIYLSGKWWQIYGNAVIRPGQSGKNTWSFVVNTTGFSESKLDVLFLGSDNQSIYRAMQLFICENRSRENYCKNVCVNSCDCPVKT
jgi:hypothetical protein